MMRSFRIRAYDEDTGYGLLRHVLVRKGYHSGQIMVVLVLVSPILPSKNNFVKALRKKFPEISTVVINVNDRKTSMVLGERNITVYGKDLLRMNCADAHFVFHRLHLSGKSAADRKTLPESHFLCQTDGKRNCDRCVLRYGHDRVDCQQPRKACDRSGVKP